MKINMIGPNDPALIVTRQVLAQHPEWHSSLELIPWAEYRDVLMNSLQAEVSLHQAVFVPGHVWIPELAGDGLISPLDPLLKEIPESSTKSYRREEIFAVVQQEGNFQDQQFMVPTFNDGQILFYRSDLLQLDSDGGPAEISPLDLPQIAAGIHNPPDLYGAALKAHPSEVLFDFMPYFYAANGKLVDDQLKPAFATEQGVRALECYLQMKEFAPENTLSYGNEEIAAVLKSDRAGLVVTWGGQAAPIFLDPENPFRELYRTALFPHPVGATWGIALPANQPEEIQLEALQIALAANSPEQDLEILTAAGSPIRRPSYTDHNLEKYFWLPAQQKMLERIRLFPRQPEFSLYLGPLTEAIYSTLQGDQDPATALNQAAEKIRHQLS